MERNYCIKCHQPYPLSHITGSQSVPKCINCNGIVKPDVILYGESLDAQILKDSLYYIRQADLLIIGGTSLSVYPAAGLVQECPGSIIIINLSPTAFDHQADLVLKNKVGTTLEKAVSLAFS